MTEAQWLTSNDPEPMLEFLLGKASERKRRLFACAAAQRLRGGPAGGSDPASQTLQSVADTGILDDGSGELSEVLSPMVGTVYLRPDPAAPPFVTIGSLIRPGTPLCLIEAMKLFNEIRAEEYGVVFDVVPGDATPVEYAEPLFWVIPAPTPDRPADLADLIRDVMGRPHRPTRLDARWRTLDCVALARGIYRDNAFDRLPILADALQDAGCDNEEVLNHCRDTAFTHVRGCWVVDLVLGRESGGRSRSGNEKRPADPV